MFRLLSTVPKYKHGFQLFRRALPLSSSRVGDSTSWRSNSLSFHAGLLNSKSICSTSRLYRPGLDDVMPFDNASDFLLNNLSELTVDVASDRIRTALNNVQIVTVQDLEDLRGSEPMDFVAILGGMGLGYKRVEERLDQASSDQLKGEASTFLLTDYAAEFKEKQKAKITDALDKHTIASVQDLEDLRGSEPMEFVAILGRMDLNYKRVEERLDQASPDQLKGEASTFLLTDYAAEFKEKQIAKITDALGMIAVATVQDLEDLRKTDPEEFGIILDIMDLNYKRVKKLLDFVFDAPEKRLNDQVLVLNTNSIDRTGDLGEKEIILVKEAFREAALNFAGPEYSNTTRENDIVIIHGASGTGKTFFAAKGLPKTSTELMQVTVYAKMSSTFNIFEDQERLEKSLRFTLAANAPILKSTWPPNEGEPKKKLDMIVSLVIDEAFAVGEYLKEYENLVAIYGIVDKYAAHPRLVVAGTNIEGVTKGLGSDDQVRKFQMLPWEPKHLEAALAGNQAQEQIMATISRHGVYRDMMSNPRAASFLAKAIQSRLKWDGGSRIVGDVVQSVAREYIRNNGLNSLSPMARRVVSTAVLQILHESSNRRGEAYLADESDVVEKMKEIVKWPSGLNHRQLMNSTMSLLEINTQTSKGDVSLREGTHYSYSISRALSIVLLALLDVVSVIGQGWSGFEVKTALMEVQHLATNMDVSKAASMNEQSWPKVSFLRDPFPPTSYKNKLKIPHLKRNTIYVNKWGAPFADVISYRRLGQCKYTRTSNKTVLVPRDEFVKLGVVKTLSDSKGKDSTGKCEEEQNKFETLKRQMGRSGAVLAALCHHWDQQCLVGDQEKLVAAKLEATEISIPDAQPQKRIAYPFGDHLISSRHESDDLDFFEYDVADDGHTLNRDSQAFASNEPSNRIEVVFYTNSPSLKFGSDCTISEEDLDIDGCIITVGKIDDLQKSLGIELKKNIEVRCIVGKK